MKWLPRETVVVPIDFSDDSFAALDTARELVNQMRQGMQTIQQKGVFTDDVGREKVLAIHRTAIDQLEGRIRTAGAGENE